MIDKGPTSGKGSPVTRWLRQRAILLASVVLDPSMLSVSFNTIVGSGHGASSLKAGMCRLVLFPNIVEAIRVEIVRMTGVQIVKNRKVVIYENLL